MFLHDLDSKDRHRNCNDPYKKFSETFTGFLNHHNPLKEKQIRDNHTPFLTKELSKAIMEKSKTINKYLKLPSRKNYVSYKKSKSKSNSLTKKAKKIFYKEATKDWIISNKKFWSTVKLFLTNKGCISNDFISVEKDGDLISKEKELGDCLTASQDEITVKEIISVYSNHPSIQKIKSVFNTDSKFNRPKPTAFDTKDTIKVYFY